MHNTVVIDGELNMNIPIDGEMSMEIPIDGEVGVFMAMKEPLPSYTGETVITPSEQPVVLGTELKTLYSNITINPIPSNYGKITWDGNTLTVS